MPFFYPFRRPDNAFHSGIIFAFETCKELLMEAEQLNIIENHLADLMKRGQDLRGYL